MFNGMTVGFVGSLICRPLLGWGSRILVLKAFVQGGLDSGQLLFKPSLAFPIPFRKVFNLCLDHAFPSMKRTSGGSRGEGGGGIPPPRKTCY